MNQSSPDRRSNRLLRERSPYLVQHAHNPVDWYPWGEEAFARAAELDKPIFLSIGYATCHWCHVMERESFENESIAAILNENFICIKVDREERPDVDAVYMTALQAMGQNGGWPMSMFLTPDRKPFYGGTYFPPEARFGRAGFPDVLRRIHEIWTGERQRVRESADGITAFLGDVAKAGGSGEPVDDSILPLCFDQIAATYDETAGGFGGGPKFPRPVVFDFLLRHYVRTGDQVPLAMVHHTLRAMSAGGMYDHIGGGFHRYSVDAEWRVPHFEKMLYDQAQLAKSYLDAFLVTKNSELAAVARATLDYVLRDMAGPAGGFCSAEDADSPKPDQSGESSEGAFYVWSKKEIIDVLGDDAAFFAFHYGVEDEGNVVVDPHHEFTGVNILYRPHPSDETARRFGISENDLRARLASSREKLFERRVRRPRPLRDDKILTSWNGLMIGALARGWRVLGDNRYGDAARAAAVFLRTALYDSTSGLLQRRYRDGESGLEAHLDDYAFLSGGLLDLYEASGEQIWLEWAVRLTEKQIALFLDPEKGGFFETSGRDPSVLIRMKGQHDGAEPSGNSVAAMNLLRLAQMLDRPLWRTIAEKTVANFSGALRAQPVAMPLMAAAAGMLTSSTSQIVIAGRTGDDTVEEMLRVVFSRYLPDSVLIRNDSAMDLSRVEKLHPSLGSLRTIEGKGAAYVCRGFTCDLPVTTADDLAHLLGSREHRGS